MKYCSGVVSLDFSRTGVKIRSNTWRRRSNGFGQMYGDRSVNILSILLNY